VLALPHGSQLYKLRSIGTVREYAATHAEDWFKYINVSRGRELNGPLYLVTGCEKTASWGLASYYSLKKTFQLSFRQTSGSEKYKWIGNPAQKRYHNASQISDVPWNQTTFIQSLCISLRSEIQARPSETVQIPDTTNMEFQSESSGGNSKPSGPESLPFSWFFGGFSRGAATDGMHARQQGVFLSDLPPISKA
jgi:hypothetical protein